jgi:hypothetical protein
VDVPANWAPKPLTSEVVLCLFTCSEGAHQQSPASDQVAARGAARVSQVLDRGAHAVARGAARCASQVFDRCAQAVASLYVAGT